MRIPEEDQIEKLLTSIVFLAESMERDRISPEELSSVLHLRSPLSLGQIPDGRLFIAIPREQIELFIGRDRIDIRDLSGNKPGRKPTAKIAIELLDWLKAKWRAVGFNYELIFSVPSGEKAGEFIVKNFLLSLEHLKDKIPISGAGIRLFYRKEHKKYTLVIEPRRREETAEGIYINVNIHRDKSELNNKEVERLSTVSSLQEDFVKEYEGILDVLKML